jgi:deoxycytidine triphosphate deaminase
MIVVSENLAGLVRSFGICNPNLIDEFSVQIKLDRQIRRLQAPSDDLPPINYESAINHAAYFRDSEQVAESLILGPRECVLACSQDVYKMPAGYFGLIQTKGSLARMFVSATANDGQVEPGYSGKVTLELINHSSFSVALRPGAAIAQLYIMRCSSEVSKPYSGRYQGATGPTLPIFD